MNSDYFTINTYKHYKKDDNKLVYNYPKQIRIDSKELLELIVKKDKFSKQYWTSIEKINELSSLMNINSLEEHHKIWNIDNYLELEEEILKSDWKNNNRIEFNIDKNIFSPDTLDFLIIFYCNLIISNKNIFESNDIDSINKKKSVDFDQQNNLKENIKETKTINNIIEENKNRNLELDVLIQEIILNIHKLKSSKDTKQNLKDKWTILWKLIGQLKKFSETDVSKYLNNKKSEDLIRYWKIFNYELIIFVFHSKDDVNNIAKDIQQTLSFHLNIAIQSEIMNRIKNFDNSNEISFENRTIKNKNNETKLASLIFLNYYFQLDQDKQIIPKLIDKLSDYILQKSLTDKNILWSNDMYDVLELINFFNDLNDLYIFKFNNKDLTDKLNKNIIQSLLDTLKRIDIESYNKTISNLKDKIKYNDISTEKSNATNNSIKKNNKEVNSKIKSKSDKNSLKRIKKNLKHKLKFKTKVNQANNPVNSISNSTYTNELIEDQQVNLNQFFGLTIFILFWLFLVFFIYSYELEIL